MFKKKIRVFTSSGTYIPTPDMKFCIVECQGGGGSGGSCGKIKYSAYGVLISGGGAGGGYCRKLFSASMIGASQAIVVGSGGASVAPPPGTDQVGPGNSGGDSLFGSFMTAKGGIGGSENAETNHIPTSMNYNPQPTIATGGDINIYGSPMMTVEPPVDPTTPLPGYGGNYSNVSGGASFLSKQSPKSLMNLTLGQFSPGTPGSLYGGGASGAWCFSLTSDVSSSAGGDGVIIITEFFGLSNMKTTVFNSSGVFTKSPGMSFCFVECQAAGGGGVGVKIPTGVGATIAGIGGAGGGYCEKMINDGDIGLNTSITVGSGGTGSINMADGTAGTNSSFGSILTANGGAGGSGYFDERYVTYGVNGQVGGTASGGDKNISGTPSNSLPSRLYGAFREVDSFGGRSFLGLSPRATTASGTSVRSDGNDGINYGSGGTGGASTISTVPSTGGNGAPGIVIVTEYIK